MPAVLPLPHHQSSAPQAVALLVFGAAIDFVVSLPGWLGGALCTDGSIFCWCAANQVAVLPAASRMPSGLRFALLIMLATTPCALQTAYPCAGRQDPLALRQCRLGRHRLP